MASNEDTWWQVSSPINIEHNKKKSILNDSKFTKQGMIKARAVIVAR